MSWWVFMLAICAAVSAAATSAGHYSKGRRTSGIELQYDNTNNQYMFLPMATTRISWTTVGNVDTVNVKIVDEHNRRRRSGVPPERCSMCGTKALGINNTGSFSITAPLLNESEYFSVHVESASDATVSSTSQPMTLKKT